jgi:hypothetical protein
VTPVCGGCSAAPAPKWRYRLPDGTSLPLCTDCARAALAGVDQAELFDQDAAR